MKLNNNITVNKLLQDLLDEIYYKWNEKRFSIDSEESICSDSSYPLFDYRTVTFHKDLNERSIDKLKNIECDLKLKIQQTSNTLTKCLKKKDQEKQKLQKIYDIITSILQAISLKRKIDTRMRFSIQPYAGDDGFEQWRDAMKAVARLPNGFPQYFRKQMWLTLAEHYFQSLNLKWENTVKICFSDRVNEEDFNLGNQIIKDLHRTTVPSFSSGTNSSMLNSDQIILKRVLLAFARWNKNIGYCQGLNVIAAVLLKVFDKNEEQTFKVMAFLIDSILPDLYYSSNLQGLSVDMAVFRDLLAVRLPTLSQHLNKLKGPVSEQSYEPPLINVYTIQWFLTIFATCLPFLTLLSVWDTLLLEGSEVIIRTALAIWCTFYRSILSIKTCDQFYQGVESMIKQVNDSQKKYSTNKLMKIINSMSPYPYKQIHELREKYIYNISPFSSLMQLGNPNLKNSADFNRLSRRFTQNHQTTPANLLLDTFDRAEMPVINHLLIKPPSNYSKNSFKKNQFLSSKVINQPNSWEKTQAKAKRVNHSPLEEKTVRHCCQCMNSANETNVEYSDCNHNPSTKTTSTDSLSGYAESFESALDHLDSNIVVSTDSHEREFLVNGCKNDLDNLPPYPIPSVSSMD